MPVWNGARHVCDGVRSVLAQSFADFELILVDDGSSDDTLDAVASLDDLRLVVVPQPHRGRAAARNAGIALARGEFIAHIDHDDLWPEDRLEVLLAALDANPTAAAAFGATVEFRDSDAPATSVADTQPRFARTPTAALVRAQAHRAIGPFAPIESADLLEWALRAQDSGLQWMSVNSLVLRRRVHATNSSHTSARDTMRVRVLADALRRRKQES